jgi:endonuclease III related protein
MIKRNFNEPEILISIFNTLLKNYGKRNWWPARTRFEMIVGAILTQNVSWKNAKNGIQNLKKDRLLHPSAILAANDKIIADKIKSTRFYNQKTIKLKTFCKYLTDNYNNSLNALFLKNKSVEDLRKELLSIKGIGKETADSIILYAGKKLSFVSDAYTKRLLDRYGLLDGFKTYDEIRNFFMINLPKNFYIYNEYHALIVHHGYLICKSKPLCDECTIKTINKNIYCLFAKQKYN